MTLLPQCIKLYKNAKKDKALLNTSFQVKRCRDMRKAHMTANKCIDTFY